MQGEQASLCFTSPPYGNQRDYTSGGISDWDGLMRGVFAQVPMAADGQVLITASSQGHFMIRAYTAKLLNIDIANIRVTNAEIGGGFGGKTVVYLEPLAVALSKKSGRPVKMTMTREDVFRGTGPTSGGTIWVKVRPTKDRHKHPAPAVHQPTAGRLPGAPAHPAPRGRGCAVVPSWGGKVKGHARTRATRGKGLAVEGIAVLGGGKAGVRADGPRAHGVHGGLRAPNEGFEPWQGVGVRQTSRVGCGVQGLDGDAFRRHPIQVGDVPARS